MVADCEALIVEENIRYLLNYRAFFLHKLPDYYGAFLVVGVESWL